jgi:hypothetical protein
VLDEWCLPEDDRLPSEESGTCGLHRGAPDLWNAPGLASVVRLRAWSASVLGSRLLETAGRLDDPLERPQKAELESYMSIKGQIMHNNSIYTNTPGIRSLLLHYILSASMNKYYKLTTASFDVDCSSRTGDFCLARLPAFIAGGGT